jgi:alcohol dehydrogenase
MKALIYHGPGETTWETKADPTITDPSDAIVRIDSSTICGTELHILKGDVPAVTPGTVLGHEAVGTVMETGTAVTTFAEGDRVLIPASRPAGDADSAGKLTTVFVREAEVGSSAT